MLFTATAPAAQGDRILLFVDPVEARGHAPDGHSIFGVAVELDASRRRLTTAGNPGEPGAWATQAYLEQHGRVIAKGPIPDVLFLGVPHRPKCRGRIALVAETSSMR